VTTRHLSLRVVVAAAAVTVCCLLTCAAPAAAHGGGADTAPTNYASEITDAGSDGLEWNVRGGDASIDLTNHTGDQVVILGYQGEPYLRFTPGDGVFENTSSPATYLNQDRYGDVDMPAAASADAPPEWRKVADGDRFAWHDHRAHWMSRIDPPDVVDDPGSTHLISEWTIPIRIGTTNPSDVRVTGQLRWLPDVAWWPPVVALTTVFVAIVAAVAVATRPRERTWRPLARAATSIVVAVAATNVIRTVDELVSGSLTSTESAVVIVSTTVALVAILGLSSRGWIGHPGGFGAIAGSAMLMMLLFGGESPGQLSAPVLETSLPEWTRRWTIAASYTVVAPALLVAIIAGHWYARDHTLTASDIDVQTSPTTPPLIDRPSDVAP
jgi:hypothetical protein